MVQLIKPQQVSISTKEGELLIHLTLDINVNAGNARIGTEVQEGEERSAEPTEKVDWAIPEFTSGRVKFGKEEKA